MVTLRPPGTRHSPPGSNPNLPRVRNPREVLAPSSPKTKRRQSGQEAELRSGVRLWAGPPRPASCRLLAGDRAPAHTDRRGCLSPPYVPSPSASRPCAPRGGGGPDAPASNSNLPRVRNPREVLAPSSPKTKRRQSGQEAELRSGVRLWAGPPRPASCRLLAGDRAPAHTDRRGSLSRAYVPSPSPSRPCAPRGGGNPDAPASNPNLPRVRNPREVLQSCVMPPSSSGQPRRDRQGRGAKKKRPTTFRKALGLSTGDSSCLSSRPGLTRRACARRGRHRPGDRRPGRRRRRPDDRCEAEPR